MLAVTHSSIWYDNPYCDAVINFNARHTYAPNTNTKPATSALSENDSCPAVGTGVGSNAMQETTNVPINMNAEHEKAVSVW